MFIHSPEPHSRSLTRSLSAILLSGWIPTFYTPAGVLPSYELKFRPFFFYSADILIALDIFS